MKFNISCESLLPMTRLVQDELDRFGIAHRRHEDGYIEVKEAIPNETIAFLNRSLSRYSLSIIDDEKECLVQRIKNILFEIVYSRKQPQTTLSAYLTDKLGYSYGFLSGLFAALTYCSIEQYTIMIRTERAKRLIIEDEFSLKEISLMLGYSSLGHFSKQFKKCTGITLSEFRKIIIRRRNSHD